MAWDVWGPKNSFEKAQMPSRGLVLQIKKGRHSQSLQRWYLMEGG